MVFSYLNIFEDILLLGKDKKLIPKDQDSSHYDKEFDQLISELIQVLKLYNSVRKNILKKKQEKMTKGLKDEFKGLLIQRAQEIEGSLEQKIINGRIQECRNIF